MVKGEGRQDEVTEGRGRAGPAWFVVAASLALGAAVSLGLARFSYALLLPPMRADLGWTYLTAGAMNTVNAGGYLVGALLMPRALGGWPARSLLLGGSASAALLLAGHAIASSDAVLYVLRALTGVASAATFVAGGLMAAQLAQAPGPPRGAGPGGSRAPGGSRQVAGSAGLVIGLYYGGTGLGIVIAALLVPPLAARALPHAWQGAWLALAATAGLATWAMARATRHLAAPAAPRGGAGRPDWAGLAPGLASYFLFGLGYIGYMTFVITLLREQGLAGTLVTVFYVVLGLGVVASSWLWAGLLQRHRGGVPMSLLNGLLALATVLPVLSAHPAAVLASGALFGGVFLSVVASTTALVRHNLAPTLWPAGIAAFTTVFAAGQIVGPSLVGWVADGGGLARGFVVSAGVLALAAALAAWQRPLTRPAAGA